MQLRVKTLIFRQKPTLKEVMWFCLHPRLSCVRLILIYDDARILKKIFWSIQLMVLTHTLQYAKYLSVKIFYLSNVLSEEFREKTTKNKKKKMLS